MPQLQTQYETSHAPTNKLLNEYSVLIPLQCLANLGIEAELKSGVSQYKGSKIIFKKYI